MAWLDVDPGYPIDAFIFGGRRGTTIPLVTEARDWVEGVYMAATLGSETTAAIAGQVGVVRRDPFAMIAFAGYNMSDYFAHWLAMGQRIEAAGGTVPKIFTVNWFRKDADGNFVWPGFSDNMRVMAWMLERVDGTAKGNEHAFGTTPSYSDLNWNGSDFTEADYASITTLDRDAGEAEVKLHAELFDLLKHNLPAELPATKAKIETRLAA